MNGYDVEKTQIVVVDVEKRGSRDQGTWSGCWPLLRSDVPEREDAIGALLDEADKVLGYGVSNALVGNTQSG